MLTASKILAGFRSGERPVYLSSWRSCASNSGKNLVENKKKFYFCFYRFFAQKHTFTETTNMWAGGFMICIMLHITTVVYDY